MSPGVTLASGRARHVPALARILWAYTRATPGLPCARSRAEDLALLWRVTRGRQVRVALAGGRPAGFVVRDGALVHALHVAPRWRGQGVGRALMAEAQARAGPLELWVLTANTRARRFYRHAGFAEAARTRGGGNDEGLPDIRMVWTAERRPA